MQQRCELSTKSNGVANAAVPSSTAWRHANPERALQNNRSWAARNKERDYMNKRRSRLRSKYGITLEQYVAMEKAQGGVCKICGHPPKTRRLDVDHCHKSKRVRGLACFQCNRLRLSGARDIDADLYERIVAYLRSDFDGRTI